MVKIAPYQPTDEHLRLGRERAYGRADRELFLDVGFFIAWFSSAELALTKLLAFSTGTTDLVAFDILCRGMDARVKIERLRQSAKTHGGIGPNLNSRLEKFNKGAVPLRNKLVHCSLTHSEGDDELTYFISGLANLPWSELGMGPPMTNLKPDKIRSLDLYAWAVWTSNFVQDLIVAQPIAKLRGQIEITRPKSRLRSEGDPKPHPQGQRATPDKRPQSPPE